MSAVLDAGKQRADNAGMRPTIADTQGRPCVIQAEAARRKHVTRQAIDQAIERGELASSKLGPLTLVTVASLAAWRPSRKKQRAAKGA